MYTTHRKIIIKQNTVFYLCKLFYTIMYCYTLFWKQFILSLLLLRVSNLIFTLYCLSYCLYFFYFIFCFLICVGFVFWLLFLFGLYFLAYLLLLFLLMILLLNSKLNKHHFLSQIRKHIICKYIIIWRFLP